jgi:hypothetical protein
MRKKWFGSKAIAARLAEENLTGATKSSKRVAG